MRIDEFLKPESEPSALSAEDTARIAEVVKQGDSAWSMPLTLDEAIAATLKITRGG